MRHAKGLRKLSRNASHRRALLRNMATSLIRLERFETTVQKAKELRPVVEKLITSGKEDTLSSRRHAYSYLLDKAVVHKLFADVGPRFKARKGGYTRIVRTRLRHGDSAEMAVIEFVDKATVTAATSKSSSKPAKSSAVKSSAVKSSPAKAA